MPRGPGRQHPVPWTLLTSAAVLHCTAVPCSCCAGKLPRHAPCIRGDTILLPHAAPLACLDAENGLVPQLLGSIRHRLRLQASHLCDARRRQIGEEGHSIRQRFLCCLCCRLQGAHDRSKNNKPTNQCMNESIKRKRRCARGSGGRHIHPRVGTAWSVLVPAASERRVPSAAQRLLRERTLLPAEGVVASEASRRWARRSTLACTSACVQLKSCRYSCRQSINQSINQSLID